MEDQSESHQDLRLPPIYEDSSSDSSEADDPDFINVLGERLDIQGCKVKLQPEVYLNDVVINFMLTVIEKVVPSPDLLARTAFFNTYFFP